MALRPIPAVPAETSKRTPARKGLRFLQNAKKPETVQRILLTAERMFAERGLAGARIDEIAADAKVNKALLYYYFGSKRELHRHVLERLFALLLTSVEAGRQNKGSPKENLLGYVNGYFDFVSRHPNYPRLVQREVMECGKHLAWIVDNYLRPLHQRLARAVERGITAGEFRRVDAQHTVTTLIAMTTFYFAAAPLLSELWGRDALHPRAVEGRRRAILDFLEHGLFRARTRSR
ncbi:MAG: TetR family transcriptional regulator [Acidobacteria bacterium]|nr:TetR family transcriptional regulator [Acidobacteriota bacterium]MBI3664520.1 TetR family transcriptional regulator [Acidobacteriota bacterium]